MTIEQTPKQAPDQKPENQGSQPAEQTRIYQPPVSHEGHVKKMMLWLAISFGTLAVLAILFIYNANNILIHLPFEAEKNFVEPYENIIRHFADDDHTQEEIVLQNYIESLSNKLVKEMDLPAEITINAHYLNCDAINAFATLGGHIFVCKGLIDALPNENSLAMVIGHEIAHIKHRDPIVGMARGFALQMLYSYLTGDYSGSTIASYGSELGLLYFSREQERKADSVGIAAINNHYGHVSGYDSLFRTIKEELESDGEENDDVPNWLSSHPALDERIESLSQQKRENNWGESLTRDYPLEVVKALEAVMASEAAETLEKQLNK